MTSKFKTLGIALAAVLAMSAALATAAQAQFTASSYPKSATATSALGNDKLNTEAGTVECKAHYAFGPLTGPSTTTTVQVTHTECKAFGFAATVNPNGCHFVYHDTADNHKTKITVVCPHGGKFVITSGPCELTVGAQGPLGNVVTTTAGNHVNAQANVTGISYTATKDGFLCPFNGTGAKTGASYVQGAAVTVEPVGGGSISVD